MSTSTAERPSVVYYIFWDSADYVDDIRLAIHFMGSVILHMILKVIDYEIANHAVLNSLLTCCIIIWEINRSILHNC